jgi:hypothetical protein
MMLFWLFGGGECIFMAKSTKNLHCLSPPLLFLSYNPSFCSFLLPKCAKTHLRAFVKSKIFPGVIPPDPHLKGRGGRSC